LCHEFSQSDVVRNSLITKILEKYDQWKLR
jgi:phosphate starvation-inducible protein PhoH